MTSYYDLTAANERVTELQPLLVALKADLDTVARSQQRLAELQREQVPDTGVPGGNGTGAELPRADVPGANGAGANGAGANGAGAELPGAGAELAGAGAELPRAGAGANGAGANGAGANGAGAELPQANGDHHSEVEREHGLVAAAVLRMEGAVRQIDAWGVTLRDIGQGLVDFPALVNGRPIWLCWKLGEGEIAWWHDLEAGVAGRKPLIELE